MTGQTTIYQDDLHFWAEVETADGRWLTVEPSPGYELLFARRPWSEVLWQALLDCAAWLWLHRGRLLLAVVAIGLAWRFRRLGLAYAARAVWRLSPRRDPRRIAIRSLKLLQRQEYWAVTPTAFDAVDVWLRQWGSVGLHSSTRAPVASEPPRCETFLAGIRCSGRLCGGGPARSRRASLGTASRAVAACRQTATRILVSRLRPQPTSTATS